MNNPCPECNAHLVNNYPTCQFSCPARTARVGKFWQERPKKRQLSGALVHIGGVDVNPLRVESLEQVSKEGYEKSYALVTLSSGRQIKDFRQSEAVEIALCGIDHKWRNE